MQNVVRATFLLHNGRAFLPRSKRTMQPLGTKDRHNFRIVILCMVYLEPGPDTESRRVRSYPHAFLTLCG